MSQESAPKMASPSDTNACQKRSLAEHSSSGGPSSKTPCGGKPPHKRLRVRKDFVAPKRSNRPGIPIAVDLYEFTVPDRHSPHPRGFDKDGHFEYQLGDSIGSRYKILSQMGEGTFGRVLECWDRKHKESVAIKIIRNVQKYRDAAMIELEVLNTVGANDPDGICHCIHLREWFDYRGHVCMVFRKLGSSLYDFLRRNGYRPFPLDIVQQFARQILTAVAFLHQQFIVHTDLKPENILLCNSEYAKVDHKRSCRLGRRVPLTPELNVIDLGSATFEDQYHSSIVSTRHYRAPEVILGLGWGSHCDVWSVGCIIVELLTGKALFQTHENLEHLAMMERVLGPMPYSMAENAHRDAHKYFDSKFHLMWPEHASTRKSIRSVDRLDKLKRLLRQEGDPSIRPHLDSLHDLLDNMLRFQPLSRLAARPALQHHFFRENIRSLLPASTTVMRSDSSGKVADADVDVDVEAKVVPVASMTREQRKSDACSQERGRSGSASRTIVDIVDVTVSRSGGGEVEVKGARADSQCVEKDALVEQEEVERCPKAKRTGFPADKEARAGDCESLKHARVCEGSMLALESARAQTAVS